MTRLWIQSLGAALIVATFPSCTSPAKPTGFLKAEPKMSKDDTTPFQRSWVDPKAKLSSYNQVFVAPVANHGSRMKNMVGNSRQLTAGKTNDLAANSQTLRSQYEKAFRASKKPWQLLSKPQRKRNALAVELNVVEIAASRPEVELAGKLVPGGGILNRPSMAIEGRIKDLRTGKVLAKFADRETPPISALSISKLQYYKAHKNLMRDWANQTVKWIERENQEKVWEALPFTVIDY